MDKLKNHVFRWVEIREFSGLGRDNKESEDFYRNSVEGNYVEGKLIKKGKVIVVS